MIATFTIHNYRSISEATLDFHYPYPRARRNRNTRELYPFFTIKNQRTTIRLLPCLGIWGPNGSGKSNFFRAMRMFHESILNGHMLPLPRNYEPNRLIVGHRPTSFTFHAYLPHKNTFVDVRYHLSYDEKEILKESLLCDGKEYLSRSQCAPCELALAHLQTPWITELRQHFSFIDPWSMTADGYGKRIIALAQTMAQDPHHFIATISAIVARLDIGIHRLDLLHHPDAPALVISTHTNTQQEEVQFDINEESDGTQRILFLVAELLAALTQGKTIIADEMDHSIHPILFRALLRMCKSTAYNHGQGQICFSTHDLSLMEDDIITPEETVLVGKIGVETRFEMLATLEKAGLTVRSLKHFRERYLEGWYQNIPYPSL